MEFLGGASNVNLTALRIYLNGSKALQPLPAPPLLVKNNYYESSTLTAKKGPMKTAAQNRSANSDGSVIARRPTFSLVNALVYVEHRPGHSLGKK